MKTQDLKELNADELKNINGGSDDGMPPPPTGDGGSGDNTGDPDPTGYDGIGKGNEYGPNGPANWHRIP